MLQFTNGPRVPLGAPHGVPHDVPPGPRGGHTAHNVHEACIAQGCTDRRLDLGRSAPRTVYISVSITSQLLG